MRPTAVAAGIVAAFLAPAPGEAQTDAPRRLSAAESEAYQMGIEMAFACSPRRHGQATGSESTIRRATDALAGTAVHFRSIEGTYLVLEAYDEDLNGHCLVLGWFGGPLEPGSYDIGRLAMSTVEEQSEQNEHSFFGISIVRLVAENSVLLVESGTLEITSMEGGRVTGTLEVAGFVSDGSGRDRVGEASWAGSFTAVEGEG